MTSDDTEQSDRDTDKLLRNRHSSRFSSRFGKYFGKLGKGGKNREESKSGAERKDSATKKGEVGGPGLRKNGTRNTAVKKGEMASKNNESNDVVLKKTDSRKEKNFAKKRGDSGLNGKLQNSVQDKVQMGKESKRGRNVSVTHGKLRLRTPDLDSESEEKEQLFTKDGRERRSLSNVGAHKRMRKNTSVTFSPTVICTTDNARGLSAQRTANMTSKGLSTHVEQNKRHVIASETSDTDSTSQEIHSV